MKATPQQIKQFRTILNNIGQQEMKDELVAAISSGRTTHASELTFKEIDALNRDLNKKQKVNNAFVPDKANTMRRRILSMCHQLGWTIWDEQKHKNIVDFEKLNNWLINSGYLHKTYKS